MKVRHKFLTARVDRLIGPLLSILLGASVAFFLLAMPADLMGWLLVAPPVGIAERLLVAMVGALVSAGAVFALFAWLDRVPPPVREDEEELDFEDVAPPVTRGDAKPRPILAGAELGQALNAVPIPAAAPVPVDAEEDALLLEMTLTPEVEEALAPQPESNQAPLESASLEELMRRLESGIERRPAAPRAAEGSRGDALRDALQELQRMAAAVR